jgi:cold shock CspA family protein
MRNRKLFTACLTAIDETIFADLSDLPALTLTYERRFATYAAAAKATPVQTPAAIPDTRPTGIVRFSDPVRGIGYISRPNLPDLFFYHSRQLGELPSAPKRGDRVSFDEVKGGRGAQAINVCNLDDPRSVAAFQEWLTPARQAHRTTEAATQSRYEDYFKAALRRR